MILTKVKRARKLKAMRLKRQMINTMSKAKSTRGSVKEVYLNLSAFNITATVLS